MPEFLERNYALFLYRALELMVAVLIWSLALECELPLPHPHLFLTNFGTAGPVVPSLCLFSNTALTRKNMSSNLQTLALLSSILICYATGVASIVQSLPVININTSKFATGYLVMCYLMSINLCFTAFDLISFVLNEAWESRSQSKAG